MTHILLVVYRRHMVVYKELIEEQFVLTTQNLHSCLFIYY